MNGGVVYATMDACVMQGQSYQMGVVRRITQRAKELFYASAVVVFEGVVFSKMTAGHHLDSFRNPIFETGQFLCQ